MGSLELGGSETTVMNYYRYIDRTKIQFDFLITNDGRNYYEDEAIALGARIFRRPMRTKRPLKNMTQLIRILQANPDIKIVHIHNSSSLAGIDSFIAMILNVSVRIVYSTSALPNASILHRLFQLLLRSTATHWAGGSIKAGISLFGKKAIDKIIVVPRARNYEMFKFNPDIRKKMRAQLSLNSELTVIHVARMVPPKNHNFILDIFTCALKLMPEMVLLLVGDGELYTELYETTMQIQINNNVRFLGRRGDVHELLQAADVFILPSLSEGLGAVAIEAQAAGLPCLLSDAIPQEAKITDLVTFLPINEGPEVWATYIINYRDFIRKDITSDIMNAGVDVHSAAKWLEKLYADALSVKRT